MRIMLFVGFLFLLLCLCRNYDVKEIEIKPQIDIKGLLFDKECYMYFSDMNNGVFFHNYPFEIFTTNDGGHLWNKKVCVDGYTLECENICNENKVFGVVRGCPRREYLYPFCYEMETGSFTIFSDSIKREHFINFFIRKGNVCILCSQRGNYGSRLGTLPVEYLKKGDNPQKDNVLVYDDLFCYSTYDEKFVVCSKNGKQKFYTKNNDIYGISVAYDKVYISAVSRIKKEISIYQYDKEKRVLDKISSIKSDGHGFATCSKIKVVGDVLVMFVGESYSPDVLYYSFDKGLTWKEFEDVLEPKFNCVAGDYFVLFKNKNKLIKYKFIKR